MFTLNCEIFIGPLPAIEFVHELTIESGWQKFTDTAKIQLPRKIKVIRDGALTKLQDVILVGDPVTIRYGYDGQLRTEFTGVVSALKPGTPFTVECEDQMWYLKRRQMSMSWRNVTLRELLTYIQGQYADDFPPRGFDFVIIGETPIGKYQINQATAAQVFDDLKKRMRLNFFFRDGVLVANHPYQKGAPRHRYDFSGQRGNVIESDLAFVKASDLAIEFKGTSSQPDGKKVTFTYDPRADVVRIEQPQARRHKGDPLPTPTVSLGSGRATAKGELRTLLVPPGLNGKALEAKVREAAGLISFDGYRGDGLLTFGRPLANHGDIAELHDPEYPKRAGSYYIDAVTKTFGMGGSRRKIKLGPKAPAA